MYDPTIITSKHANHTFGEDQYGTFGSIFASEDELNIPSPIDFNPATEIPNSPNFPHQPINPQASN
jgi:hypothetical protein